MISATWAYDSAGNKQVNIVLTHAKDKTWMVWDLSDDDMRDFHDSLDKAEKLYNETKAAMSKPQCPCVDLTPQKKRSPDRHIQIH